jgi:hypothetical protein
MNKELYCNPNCIYLLDNIKELSCSKYGIILEKTHLGIEACFACRNNIKEEKKNENN